MRSDVYTFYIHILLTHQCWPYNAHASFICQHYNVHETTAVLSTSPLTLLLLDIYWRSSGTERWRHWFLLRSCSSKIQGLATALFPITTIYGYPVVFAFNSRFPIVNSERSSIITLSQKAGICWINEYNSSPKLPITFSSLLPA